MLHSCVCFFCLAWRASIRYLVRSVCSSLFIGAEPRQLILRAEDYARTVSRLKPRDYGDGEGGYTIGGEYRFSRFRENCAFESRLSPRRAPCRMCAFGLWEFLGIYIGIYGRGDEMDGSWIRIGREIARKIETRASVWRK